MSHQAGPDHDHHHHRNHDEGDRGRVPSLDRAHAQSPEPAMDQDHDQDPPDRDDPAPVGPSGAPPASNRPGLLAMVLALASKIPLPSLGTERHEMVLDAPSPDATQGRAAPAPAPAPEPKKVAGRFPLLAWKRETRVGIAALISFVVLVGALILRRGEKAEKGEAGKSPLLAVNHGAGANPDPPAPGAKPDKPKVEPGKPAGGGEKGNKPGEERAPAPGPGPGEVPRLHDPDLLTAPGREPRPIGETDPVEPAKLPLPSTGAGPSAALGDSPTPVIPPTLPAPGGSTPRPPDPPADAPDPIPLPDPKPDSPASTPAAIPELPPFVPDEKPKGTASNPAQSQAAEPPTMTPPGEPSPPPSPEPAPVASARPAAIAKPRRPEPASNPVASGGPVPAENPPTLEAIPAAGSIESATTRASIAGGIGAGGWIAIPSGGRRIVGSVPIVSTPAEAQVDATPRVADGPRVVDDPAAVDQVEPVVHVVRPGENFWTISILYYRSGRFYKALHAANRRQVPEIAKLYVGTVLRIPPPEALDRALIDPPGRSNPGEPATSTVSRTSNSRRAEAPPAEEADLAMPARPRRVLPDPEAVAAPRRPTYKVKDRETLRGIARDTLDDSKRYREIYNLNRDVLDDINDPLPAGTTLTLPEDAVVGRRASR